MSKRGRKRRNFTAAEKATILRRHLVDKVPVSDLCDEYKLHPNLFYVWQQQALANLERAIEKADVGDAVAIEKSQPMRQDGSMTQGLVRAVLVVAVIAQAVIGVAAIYAGDDAEPCVGSVGEGQPEKIQLDFERVNVEVVARFFDELTGKRHVVEGFPMNSFSKD